MARWFLASVFVPSLVVLFGWELIFSEKWHEKFGVYFAALQGLLISGAWCSTS